ncbi:hypothetical protein ABN028_33580 [Actinopolymorpha sp. B17G11]|uniref:hypothetical protein n=1 Tax=Actinopolymorpha sp. B17G11 TaxID=3160861 RepID=UPI0032E52B62
MNEHQHDQDLTANDLRAGLTRLATYARTHHDPAADAMHRARRIRIRRRATGVVASVAAVALALPLSLNLLSPPGDHTRVDRATVTPTPAHTPGRTPPSTPSPIATPTVGVSPAPTAGPVVAPYAPKSLREEDFAGLPRGEDPKVPWYADGKIHNGATTTPVDLPDWTSFDVVDSGYVVTSYDNNQVYLQLVGLDGTQKLTAPGRAVVSSDRRQIAWATPDGTVNVADARTGRVLHSIDVGKGGRTVGFLGEQVMLSSGSWLSEPAVAQEWDPKTGQLTLWQGFYGADTTDRASLVGLVPKVAQERQSEQLYCAATIDTGNGNGERWRVCPTELGSHVSIRGFSPNGRYAVVEIMGEGQTVPHYTIADGRTGKPLLTIRLSNGNMAWEDEEHFLLASYGQGEPGIVRCTVAGSCEVATKHRPADGRWYKLPGT